MFLIYGRKKAKIKQVTDQRQACANCGNFGHSVTIYRDYYHFFFIPIIPIGNKEIRILCSHCGDTGNNVGIYEHYDKLTRTPLYLYTWSIIIGWLIIFGIVMHQRAQKEKAEFITS